MDRETVETVADFISGDSKISMVYKLQTENFLLESKGLKVVKEISHYMTQCCLITLHH